MSNPATKLGLLLASCGIIIALLAGSPTEPASASRTYSNSTVATTFYIVEDNLMH